MANWRGWTGWCIGALLTSFWASSASADTLLMPPRDMLMGTSEVVWGVTTQANGTAFVLDYGDGSAQSSGPVGDRSYIAFPHTYALSGIFTATLCVGAGAAVPGCPGEQATVVIKVYNGALLSAFDLRNLNINRAIENGLRYLWSSQQNRAANFPAGTTTFWNADYQNSNTALIVLAFENHGYHLPNDNSVPAGVYERFIVQRGLNYVLTNTVVQSLNVQTLPAPNRDACVGAGIEAAPCTGYAPSTEVNSGNYPGYSTAVVSLPLAASGALSRTNPAGPGAGKTYREVLQRLMNTVAWGQIDVLNCSGRGGWHYSLANNGCDSSDGSTAGWNLLALLDATSAGITIPDFVKPEFSNFALPAGFNIGGTAQNDGTFDYNADQNPLSSQRNLGKVGIALQGHYFAGKALGNSDTQASINAVNLRWPTGSATGDDGWVCGGARGGMGCGYPMFNVFKGLKLFGVQTLPGVTRPAGPGPIPAGDWYADYVDYLITNQVSPTSTSGGNWAMSFSCCGLNNTVSPGTAMAELILSPVALIAPDPTLFSTVGLLQGGPPLSTADDTNPVGTNHTVTAQVRAEGNVPVPGATVNFAVISGPNTGVSGTCNPVGCVTPASGDVTWTYLSNGSIGTDVVRANIGNLQSNPLNKIWIVPVSKCDVNDDKKVDMTDLNLIRARLGTVASGPNDQADGNSDGVINVADLRYCALRLTP